MPVRRTKEDPVLKVQRTMFSIFQLDFAARDMTFKLHHSIKNNCTHFCSQACYGVKYRSGICS